MHNHPEHLETHALQTFLTRFALRSHPTVATSPNDCLATQGPHVRVCCSEQRNPLLMFRSVPARPAGC